MNTGGRFLRNQEWGVIGLLFGLLLVASLFFNEVEPAMPYDPDSAGPQGLLALRLWLEEMGHPVHVARNNLWESTAQSSVQNRAGSANGAINSSDIELLFIYPNAAPYTKDEAQMLQRWVASGGALVLIGPDLRDRELRDAFGVFQRNDLSFAAVDYQQQPLLPDSSAALSQPGLRAYLDLADAPRAVPVLASQRFSSASSATGPDGPAAQQTPLAEETSPPNASTAETATPDGEPSSVQNVTAAVQQVGSGVVWHLSSHHALTNSSLRQAEAAHLVPALLRTLAPGAQVAIDAYHLFNLNPHSENRDIDSLRAWLYKSNLGWATLFLMALSLLYLILQGRRLGPPLPVQTAQRQREAAEYVEAMAGLQRRAGQQAAVAAHFKQRLKVRLARTHRLRTDLDDAAFVTQLGQSSHQLSDSQLATVAHLLHVLENKPNEHALINAVQQIDEMFQI